MPFKVPFSGAVETAVRRAAFAWLLVVLMAGGVLPGAAQTAKPQPDLAQQIAGVKLRDSHGRPVDLLARFRGAKLNLLVLYRGVW